jgi:hypothetical protein
LITSNFHRTALTKDLFEDLTITFNSDLFDTFQAKKNYAIQSLEQLRNCNSKLAIHVTICFLLTPQSESCWRILIGFSLIICASIIFYNDIKKVKNQTNNNRHVLRAVTNKCLRKLADETVDADDIRQFFIDQLDEVLNELKQL